MKMKGFLYAILSGLFFGSAGLFVKNGYNANFSPVDLLMLQYIIAAVILSILCFINYRNKLRLSPFMLKKLIIQGALFNTLMTVFFYESFKYLPMAVTTMLLFTYPSMVALVSFVAFKKKITFSKLLSILGTFFGCLLVMKIFSPHKSFDSLGILFALLSAVFYSCMNLYAENIVEDIPGMVITLYSTIFSLLVLLILNFGFLYKLPSISGQSVLNAGLLSFFCEIIPLTLLYEAIGQIGSVNTSIITSLELPASALLGYFVLHEPLNLSQILGILLVVLCVARLKNDTE